MYLYLSKADAQDSSSKTEFIINLPPNGIYPSGEIGLCEIYFKFNRPNVDCFDLCCDLCDTSIVGGCSERILRRVHVERVKKHLTFDSVFYIPVIKPWVASITLYIKGVQSDFSSVELEMLNCTLHIRERS